jgi:hypothetical protein
MEGLGQRQEDPPTNDNVTHYLALYLLLLAFFIVMTSVSKFEESRSRAVVRSVQSTFSTQVASVGDPRFLLSKSGTVVDLPEIQDEFQRLIETEISVVEVKKLEDGRVLQLTVPVDSLFLDGEIEIRPARRRLLERISAVLARRRAGLLYSLDFVLGSESVAVENSDGAESLSIARSGRFARALWEHGSPANAVSAGIRRGDPGKVRFLFYVRVEEQSGAEAE